MTTLRLQVMDLCVPSIRVKSDSKVQTDFVPNSRQSRRWSLSQPHSGQTSLIDHHMADAVLFSKKLGGSIAGHHYLSEDHIYAVCHACDPTPPALSPRNSGTVPRCSSHQTMGPWAPHISCYAVLGLSYRLLCPPNRCPFRAWSPLEIHQPCTFA